MYAKGDAYRIIVVLKVSSCAFLTEQALCQMVAFASSCRAGFVYDETDSQPFSRPHSRAVKM